MERDFEQELIRWKEQEQKYARLFSPSVLKSKGFKKERLNQLLVIQAKYKKVDLQDPSVLVLLKIEKRQLERQISPGIFSFLLRKMIDAVRLYNLKKRHDLQEVDSISNIRGSLNRIGLGKHADRAEEILARSKGPATISHIEQLAPKQTVEYTLHFNKNPNHSSFDGYTVAYKDETTNTVRRQDFKHDELGLMPLENATKLLAGQAIKESTKEWVQMDFNDKDAQGNYKLIRFSNERLDEGIMDALSKLPTKDNLSNENKLEIFQELSKGNPFKVTLTRNAEELQAVIYANPRQSGIIVMNNDGKVLDPAKITREDRSKTLEVRHLEKQVKTERKRIKVAR